MDEIGDIISQIVNDPERMQQVMELAKNLSLGDEPKGSPPISPERIEAFGKMIQQTQHSDKKQEALVHALRPYLKPGRRSKLDKAMQIARMSQLAGFAFSKDPET